MADDEEPLTGDDVWLNLSGQRSTHSMGIAEDRVKGYAKDDIAWSAKLTNADKVRLAAAMPDIWFSNGDGTKMEYRCRNGVWTWKHLSDNGLVLGEGEGPP